MIDYLRSTHYRPSIKKRIELQPGSWVRCEKPNDAEKDRLIELGVDRDILIDALDPHEIPRVELEEGQTYFITRLQMMSLMTLQRLFYFCLVSGILLL